MTTNMNRGATPKIRPWIALAVAGTYRVAAVSHSESP